MMLKGIIFISKQLREKKCKNRLEHHCFKFSSLSKVNDLTSFDWSKHAAFERRFDEFQIAG